MCLAHFCPVLRDDDHIVPNILPAQSGHFVAPQSGQQSESHQRAERSHRQRRLPHGDDLVVVQRPALARLAGEPLLA